MLLKEIPRCGCILASHILQEDYDLRGLVVDSRKTTPTTAFYAIRGGCQDGHRFVEQAAAMGAPAIFVGDKQVFESLCAAPPPGVFGIFLVVPDRKTLADISGLVYEHPSQKLNLLGVTGTNGKTTTTYLAAQMLHGLGQPCAILGGLGMRLEGRVRPTERTTPEAPDIQSFLDECVGRGAHWAALEVSSIGLDLERTRGLCFKGGAFTNFSQDHLDFHADMAAYLEAKTKFFSDYPIETAVINVDDREGVTLADRLKKNKRSTLTYGLNNPADLTARQISLNSEGASGILDYQGQTAPFSTPLLGKYNLYNLLAALGLLLAGGIGFSRLPPLTGLCAGAPGRFERVTTGHLFLAVVDYAHTPDGLENLLSSARILSRGRVLLAFGCGGERDAAKRPLMGLVGHQWADVLVLTNDNPRGEHPEAILDQIEQGIPRSGPDALSPSSLSKQMVRIPNRKEAIFWLLDQAQPGDVVLIVGKGDEAYQEIGGIRHPFSDREVVAQWAKTHPPG
ncbi:MAG: UDP-N-acetylmuramoyl-L-alanyl-D-glutamate--2,6-diaminopimelate ligase [Deltaproteobacteria bacterium]|nr:UDP-N-acetylmuramoyl-L-alanyl-D-glutamate--2,6-diaminopimelate ligase [Deltaproteobacteria bacterium]